jgi:hypothetical protein
MNENPCDSDIHDTTRRSRSIVRRLTAYAVIFSLGSITAQLISLSLRSESMISVARGEPTPARVLSAAGRLFDLAVVLAAGSLICAIPVVRRGSAIRRVAVMVGFLAAVAFLLLMV